MPKFTQPLPLSLYIHLPWCVQKCPYCDFNSHEMKAQIPEKEYVAALLAELHGHLPLLNNRPIQTIFFGGGTPSLFSAQAIEAILAGVNQLIPIKDHAEITMEANPGTIDQVRFHEFRLAGINRLSLGIQSLQNDKLKTLGRIHDRDNAMRAIDIAKAAGFDNFNLDLMYGLPDQSITDALEDIETALSFAPTHFSWYQLTIEPNTLFYHHTPTLPPDDDIWEMQLAGQSLLSAHGFKQYEVSAYSQPERECQHNLNYWQFGDYLGIGAGAHSKITDDQLGSVIRFSQVRHPKDYLDASKRHSQGLRTITHDDLIFEFMLNALRLSDGFELALFAARTGLDLSVLLPLLHAAHDKKFILIDQEHLRLTELGKKFLNNVVEIFLPNRS